MIGTDMMENICSYLKVEDLANLEQTFKKINSEIERTYIWKKLAKRLLRKFQYIFLQDAYKAVQDSSEQHTENDEKHVSKWIIVYIVLCVDNTQYIQGSSMEQLLGGKIL